MRNETGEALNGRLQARKALHTWQTPKHCQTPANGPNKSKSRKNTKTTGKPVKPHSPFKTPPKAQNTTTLCTSQQKQQMQKRNKQQTAQASTKFTTPQNTQKKYQ
ncbi:MAG: hypothetical protein HS113_29765 [Verrucomicrobiales bacterium]|nr:hypothetical protein [Verrucomicrobiales bacterium]